MRAGYLRKIGKLVYTGACDLQVKIANLTQFPRPFGQVLGTALSAAVVVLRIRVALIAGDRWSCSD
jgi:hypothetical protein